MDLLQGTGNCIYGSCYLLCAVDCVFPHVFISASQKIVLSEGRIQDNNPKHVACGRPLMLSEEVLRELFLYIPFQILL